jgi:hypothetical protein
LETPSKEDEELKFQDLLASFEGVRISITSLILQGTKGVEVVFSFDTTGSMASCLTEVRKKVTETVARLMKDIPNMRIGIIGHGDYCDQVFTLFFW